MDKRVIWRVLVQEYIIKRSTGASRAAALRRGLSEALLCVVSLDRLKVGVATVLLAGSRTPTEEES